jgi:arylsulfatase A-like enzyme
MALLPSPAEYLEKQADASWQWRHTSKELTLPEDAWFITDLGVKLAAPPADGDTTVEFWVGFGDDARKTTVIRRRNTIAQFAQSRTWIPVGASLGKMAGKTGHFYFHVTIRPHHGDIFDPEGIVPAWGNPKLVAATTETADTRPNVLLICLDTLRADHLGVYGYPLATSPNIDALAKETVRFKHAIAASSWTLPSHASLFSGLDPDEHGAVYKEGVVPPSVDMLAELAHRHGYQTAAITENGFVSASHGFSQGFERYVSEKKVDAEATFERARDWLERKQEDPFFLFVHTYEIHAPYDPPAVYAEKFITSEDANAMRSFAPTYDHTVIDLNEEQRRHAIELYDGEIAYTDYLLGAFLQDFKARGLWENTLVILFSDHGEQLWDHGGYGHGNTLYEEVVHVPLLVKPAGVAAYAQEIDRPVSLTDIYATVADSMNWPIEQRANSYSFRSLVEPGRTPAYERDYLASVVSIRQKYGAPVRRSDPQRRAYRADGWVFIRDFTDTPEPQLYDLDSDPREQHNLIDSEPDRAKTLRLLIDAYAREAVESGKAIASKGAVPEIKISPEQQEMLNGIGYR